MEPRTTIAASLAALALVAGLAWLVVGRARGEVKRLAYRAALLLGTAALVALADRRGIFLRSSPGFAAALLGIVLLVVVGNLYSVRFCLACGRMVRNFGRAGCPRCGATLPRHGFTRALRTPRQDPIAPLRPRADRRPPPR